MVLRTWFFAFVILTETIFGRLRLLLRRSRDLLGEETKSKKPEKPNGFFGLYYFNARLSKLSSL